jgi:glycosyltransferase involved in cell wall biosynthesis
VASLHQNIQSYNPRSTFGMNKKVKVLECIRQGQIGGGESHLLVLVENMDRSKFDPVVLSFTEGPMIDRLNEMNIKNYVIKTQRPFDYRIWKEVKKLMIAEKIDIVHAHGSRANSNVFSPARSLGIPLVYTVHGWSFHPDQNFLTRSLRVIGERYLTSRTDLNISVSESNKQSGRKYIADFESVVVTNGIDQQKFDPRKQYKDIRKEFGIAANKILVLFLARFTAHKQPLALIEAFAKVIGKNPHLHLLMVGDGDQKAEAVELISKYNLKDNITLVPFRLDVPDIVAAADIYVLPSLWEGLPIALLEAMAMGKAVIGSKVDGTSEVIDNFENGVFVDPNNLVPELAEKMEMLSKDEAMRNKFRDNAIKTINEKYNAVHMTRTIEDIYCGVLEKKSAKLATKN